MKKLLFIIVFTLTVFATNAQEKLQWPLSHDLHNNTYVSNYVDTNTNANVFQDFNCGNTHGYDGHLGTDFAVNTFRDSDQGVGILAAASGTVTLMRNNQFDRNFWPPYIGIGNGVWILQDNGKYAIYWHMRQSSIPVKVGDHVEANQFIGYVASSGNTPIPHLHFQINNSSNLSDSIDPYAGNCGQNESLWDHQPEYVGNQPLRILDFGITNNRNYQGVYQNGVLTELKEKFPMPKTYANSEDKIGVWVQFQGNAFDELSYTLTSPSGETFAHQNYSLFAKRRYGWYVRQFPFSTNNAESGLWTLTVVDGKNHSFEKTFMVSDETTFEPRFYPISGKSFQINGNSQSYNTVEMGLSGKVNYQLIGAPEGFMMTDNVLTIPAISAQTNRNLAFSIQAYNEIGSDYFRVHIVDHSKPVYPQFLQPIFKNSFEQN